MHRNACKYPFPYAQDKPSFKFRKTTADFGTIDRKATKQVIVNFEFVNHGKMQVWLGKITETLKLGWSAAERAHIVKLQEIITEHGDWFEPRTNKMQAEEVDDDISLTMFDL